MREIKKVFVDLDDVLNHFTRDVLRWAHDRSFEESDYPSEVGFRLFEALQKLSGGEPMTEADFWSAIPESIWARSEPRNTHYLYEFANVVGKENVFILSTPTDYSSCWSGKCQWLRKNVPAWAFENSILMKHKHLLARPDSLLIDDSERNIRNWRRAGGIGHLVVRPWNSGVLPEGVTVEDTLEAVLSTIVKGGAYA